MKDEFENAWHHVRGITSDEMKRAAAEAERVYGDIIDLPRPVSRKHPPLSMEQKAAQYNPFAALTGYEDAVDEAGRLTQERVEPDEDMKAKLDEKLQQIQMWIGEEKYPEISFTWFVPDLLKDGGEYMTESGAVRKIDLYFRKVVLTGGREIMIDDIFDIRW